MKRLSTVSILLVGAVLLTNCSKSSSGSSGSLAFDKSSYAVTSGSTASLVLTLSGYTDPSGVTVTIASSGTAVAVPLSTSCHLSDAAGAINSCPIQVKGLALGSATVTASGPGLASASAGVTVSASPGAGTLGFSPAGETVDRREHRRRSTSRSNQSSGVTGLTVTISSSNPAAATVSPTTCVLSTANPNQTVTITGVAPGSASIVASATGYVNATNAVTAQASGSVPGTLSFGGNVPVPVGGTQYRHAQPRGQFRRRVSFTATLSTANANATISPTTCPLSTASPVCHFTITGVSVGNDPITATAGVYTTPSMVAVVGGGPTPGNLVFANPSSSVVSGSTATASLSLAGSVGVTSVAVTLTTSGNISIASTTCTVTPTTPCLITITGGAAGSGTLTAAATGYTSAVDNVTVLAGGNVVYGNLEFTTANLALLPGSSASTTLQLVDSSNVSNLVVNLSSTPAGLVTFNPTSCTFSTAGINSCIVSVTAGATAGTATISTTAVGPSIQAAAAVTVSPSAPPQMVFSSPNSVVIAQANTNNVGSVLTMTNVPAGGVNVNLAWASGTPATMTNSPGFCTFTPASPTCSVNVVHGSVTDPAGGPYTFVASVPDGSIAPAKLPVYIAALTPVDRTITVVNNCAQTVFAGISGGAVKGTVAPACPPGSTSVTTLTGPLCYWNPPAPTNGYQLTTGQSTKFVIPGSTFANGLYQWNGNIMARLGCTLPNGACPIGDCSGGIANQGYACAPGISFNTPQTMAEFTLLANGVDAYDITLMNGVIVPTTMSPDGLVPAASDPYTNGTAGATVPQFGSQTVLNPATWTFDPGATDTSTPSIYYNLVTPAAPLVPCSTSTPCTAPQQVCGYSLGSFTTPGPTYQTYCGQRLGYLTADAIWKGNADKTSAQSNTAPFDFYTSPGSSPYMGHTLIDCPNPPLDSGYNSQLPVNTCGCTDWANIASPTQTCTTINPDWVSYVLPKIAWLKLGCPTCYTYAFDDMSSSFTASAPASTTNAANAATYTVTFCPNGVSVPPY